jgi:hypothetical protein
MWLSKDQSICVKSPDKNEIMLWLDAFESAIRNCKKKGPSNSNSYGKLSSLIHDPKLPDAVTSIFKFVAKPVQSAVNSNSSSQSTEFNEEADEMDEDRMLIELKKILRSKALRRPGGYEPPSLSSQKRSSFALPKQ